MTVIVHFIAEPTCSGFSHLWPQNCV